MTLDYALAEAARGFHTSTQAAASGLAPDTNPYAKLSSIAKQDTTVARTMQVQGFSPRDPTPVAAKHLLQTIRNDPCLQHRTSTTLAAPHTSTGAPPTIV